MWCDWLTHRAINSYRHNAQYCLFKLYINFPCACYFFDARTLSWLSSNCWLQPTPNNNKYNSQICASLRALAGHSFACFLCSYFLCNCFLCDFFVTRVRSGFYRNEKKVFHCAHLPHTASAAPIANTHRLLLVDDTRTRHLAWTTLSIQQSRLLRAAHYHYCIGIITARQHALDSPTLCAVAGTVVNLFVRWCRHLQPLSVSCRLDNDWNVSYGFWRPGLTQYYCGIGRRAGSTDCSWLLVAKPLGI